MNQNSRTLSPYRYQFEEGYYNSSGECDHFVYAYSGEALIGTLSIDSKDEVILDIFVEPAHRRKGVATAMFNLALRHIGVEHCEERTLEGEAWARSLDADLPPSLRII